MIFYPAPNIIFQHVINKKSMNEILYIFFSIQAFETRCVFTPRAQVNLGRPHVRGPGTTWGWWPPSWAAQLWLKDGVCVSHFAVSELFKLVSEDHRQVFFWERRGDPGSGILVSHPQLQPRQPPPFTLVSLLGI